MLEYKSSNIRMWSRMGPSGALGAAAIELAAQNDKILLLTSDLCFFSGLERFKAEYPDRIYNFGIAEQNMIGAAGGLASEGYIPFATTYASFACSRCADQVRVNMAYMKLPIKLIGLTSGFAAGILGATHMCVEDIAVMRALPNIVILSPADCVELTKCMLAAAETRGPVYIRLTGPVDTPIVYREEYTLEIGKGITLRRGSDVAIIATGSMVYQSLKAAEQLEEHGITSSVINVHTIKPLDTDAIDAACASHRLIVTAEEHSVLGGLGAAVAEHMAKEAAHPPLEMIGIPDCFPHAGEYSYLCQVCGLDAQSIADRIFCRLTGCKDT